MASDMLEHQLLDLIDNGLWNEEKTAIVPSKMDDFIEECMREGVSRYLARCSALKCSHNHDTNHDTIDFSSLGKLIIEVLGYGSFSQGVIALALELLGIERKKTFDSISELVDFRVIRISSSSLLELVGKE